VTIRIQFPVFVDKGVTASQPEWRLFTSLILANKKGENEVIAMITNL
jgi:hypothetical protein